MQLRALRDSENVPIGKQKLPMTVKIQSKFT